VSAAFLYPEPFGGLIQMRKAVSFVGPSARPSSGAAAPVASQPLPPVKAPARPSVAPPEPEAGAPPAARQDAPATVVTPTAPSEPAGGAGVPAERCATPSPPSVALSGREVLGPVIGVQIDTTAASPRCLYVIERGSGVQWVVDSARVEVRAQ
jgi:hypothetical protein